MSHSDTVGRRINRARTERGFTLEGLADLAGLSKSFLWEVEQDRSGISCGRLLEVANALGASVDYLLKGEPVPKEYEPQSIEVPQDLGEVAEELGLGYRQTMLLMDIDRSLVARRVSRSCGMKGKEEWRSLYEAVSDFLEESSERSHV